MRENWIYRRGDIYTADLRQARGCVQSGVRPVVLVQNDTGNFFAPTLIVVPITSNIRKKPTQPTHYLVRQTQGLRSDGIALGEQITTIDKRQCIRYLGQLSHEETEAIKAIAICAIGGVTDA